MKFTVSGSVEIPNGKRAFTKEVEAESEKHAKEMVYTLFGSQNGLTRKKVTIDKVSKVQ